MARIKPEDIPDGVNQGGEGDKSKVVGAGKIKERFLEATKAMRVEQYDYWINHSFLYGEQWVYINPISHTIAQTPRDPDRVQITVDRLWPASRTIISKHTSRPLVFRVPASAADDGAVRAAHLAESVLRSVAVDHNWEGVREDAAWATWKGGTAAICVDWDPSKGQDLGTRQDGSQFGTGDTVETALSIVNFVVQPGVRDAERALWWIKNMALPPEDVKAQFNLPKLPDADANAASMPSQAGLAAQNKKGAGHNPDVKLTRVLTYYERPNPATPDGRICVVVGDKIVDDGAWVFPFRDHLNFAITHETRVDGQWMGKTVFTVARGIQTAINQSWSSIVEHMKLAGNARLVMPSSAIDTVDTLTDSPGEILEYPDGVTPPAWISPPQMPQWWIEQPQVLAKEMDDCLGSHDASRGESPTNIESGLGLSILIEQDNTPVGRMTKEAANAWGKVASMVLKIYEARVTETRKAIIRTPNQAPETSSWMGQDLLGETNAVVPVESIMPKSKAEAMNLAKTLVEMQLITTVEQFVKVSEMSESADMLESISPDVSKARRENYEMATGKPRPPAVFDDHNIHNAEHMAYMKSAAWDQLPPEAQQIFLLHVQGHSTLSAEQLGNQAAKAAVNPLLATAAQTTSVPVIPPAALAMAAPQGGGPPGTPPQGPGGPPTPGAPGAPGAPGPQDQGTPPTPEPAQAPAV